MLPYQRTNVYQSLGYSLSNPENQLVPLTYLGDPLNHCYSWYVGYSNGCRAVYSSPKDSQEKTHCIWLKWKVLDFIFRYLRYFTDSIPLIMKSRPTMLYRVLLHCKLDNECKPCSSTANPPRLLDLKLQHKLLRDSTFPICGNNFSPCLID